MAEYFIKNGGDDGADGLTDGTAWATFEKVRASIAAGNQYYFNRGDTFTPAISSGNYAHININGLDNSAEAYGVIGAYGTGAKPIIEERVTLTEGWTNHEGNIYIQHLTDHWVRVNRCFVDGVESMYAANHDATNATDRFWWYDTTNFDLYLYSTTDPNDKTVILCVGNNRNWFNNSSYWKIEDLEFRGVWGLCEFGTSSGSECSYFEFNRLNVYWAGTGGGSGNFIYCSSKTADPGAHHFTITGCDIDGKGALISKVVTEAELAATWGYDTIKVNRSASAWTITNNTFKDGYHAHILAQSESGYDGLRNFTITGNTHTGTNSPYIRAWDFAGPTAKCHDHLISKNNVYDINVRNQIGGDDNIISYNLIHDMRLAEGGANPHIAQALTLFAGAGNQCDGIRVLNNTIYNIPNEGIWLNWSAALANCDITNNILWNCGQSATDYDPYFGGDAITVDASVPDTNHFHNNVIYNSADTTIIRHNGTIYNLADAVTAAPTVYVDNIQSDPLCTSTSNFTLQSGSPARNAGIDVDLTTDYAGNPVGLVPDIGAYEYAAVAPTVTTTAESDVTMTTAASGGNVTNGGDATVTVRGVCWSTSENPTISNSKTEDGSGTGAFTSAITGLTLGTTYHVRAYATNSAGTSYGADNPLTTDSATAGGANIGMLDPSIGWCL